MLKHASILTSILCLSSCSSAGFLGSGSSKKAPEAASETSSEQPSTEQQTPTSPDEVIDDLIKETGKDGISQLPHEEMQRLCGEIPKDQIDSTIGSGVSRELTIVKSTHIQNTGNNNTIKAAVTEKISILCITSTGNGSQLTVNVQGPIGFIYFASASNSQNLTVNVAKDVEVIRVAGNLIGNDAHVTLQGEGKYTCPTKEADVIGNSTTISCK